MPLHQAKLAVIAQAFETQHQLIGRPDDGSHTTALEEQLNAAAEILSDRLASEAGHRFRSAPLPPWLRRASLNEAYAVYEPRRLGEAIGELLQAPEPLDTRHITVPKVSVAERLAHLRALLRRGTFSFDEAVANADRVTVAVTLFALLELYKQGEATWAQDEPFGEITVQAARSAPERATA